MIPFGYEKLNIVVHANTYITATTTYKLQHSEIILIAKYP